MGSGCILTVHTYISKLHRTARLLHRILCSRLVLITHNGSIRPNSHSLVDGLIRRVNPDSATIAISDAANFNWNIRFNVRVGKVGCYSLSIRHTRKLDDARTVEQYGGALSDDFIEQIWPGGLSNSVPFRAMSRFSDNLSTNIQTAK